jgi:hypothetical protein
MLLFVFVLFLNIANSYQGQKIDDTVINITDEGKPAVIVFYSNYSCHDCFYYVRDAIEEIDSINKIVLIRCNNSILQRREMMQGAKKIFGKKWQFLFDIHKSQDIWPPNNLKEGLFGKYKVNITPSILLIYSKDSVVFVSFKKTVNKKTLIKTMTDFRKSIKPEQSNR